MQRMLSASIGNFFTSVLGTSLMTVTISDLFFFFFFSFCTATATAALTTH